MKNRGDIKNFILKIENDFPVTNWTANGIHLWPIIRIKLFFYLITVVEGKKDHNNLKELKISLSITFRTRIWNYFKKIFKIILSIVKCLLWFLKLPQREILFVGADSHRVNYRGFRFNRYFDTFIEKYNLEKKAVYFEYGDDLLTNQYNRDLILKFKTSLSIFLKLNKIREKEAEFCLDGYQSFLDHLNGFSFFEFTENNSSDRLKYWANNKFLPSVNFFSSCLKRIQPEKIVILCYYSDDIMALIVAGNQLNIETIEMQHGPQTDSHLCYGSWSNMPDKGYDMLPITYWCWDSYSKNVFKRWIGNKRLYSTKVVGNPWVYYWKSKKESYPHKDFIFYSLQPYPIKIEQLFTEDIIRFIKNEPYEWFVRLHPRQLDKLNEIEKYLEERGVLHLVNILEATNDPLPQILANALIHITHCSGSALEAINFNVLTVFINEIGLDYFSEMIQNNQAVYLDYREKDFGKKFKDIIDGQNENEINPIFVSEDYENLFV